MDLTEVFAHSENKSKLFFFFLKKTFILNIDEQSTSNVSGMWVLVTPWNRESELA